MTVQLDRSQDLWLDRSGVRQPDGDRPLSRRQRREWEREAARLQREQLAADLPPLPAARRTPDQPRPARLRAALRGQLPQEQAPMSSPSYRPARVGPAHLRPRPADVCPTEGLPVQPRTVQPAAMHARTVQPAAMHARTVQPAAMHARTVQASAPTAGTTQSLPLPPSPTPTLHPQALPRPAQRRQVDVPQAVAPQTYLPLTIPGLPEDPVGQPLAYPTLGIDRRERRDTDDHGDAARRYGDNQRYTDTPYTDTPYTDTPYTDTPYTDGTYPYQPFLDETLADYPGTVSALDASDRIPEPGDTGTVAPDRPGPGRTYSAGAYADPYAAGYEVHPRTLADDEDDEGDDDEDDDGEAGDEDFGYADAGSGYDDAGYSGDDDEESGYDDEDGCPTAEYPTDAAVSDDEAEPHPVPGSLTMAHHQTTPSSGAAATTTMRFRPSGVLPRLPSPIRRQGARAVPPPIPQVPNRLLPPGRPGVAGLACETPSPGPAEAGQPPTAHRGAWRALLAALTAVGVVVGVLVGLRLGHEVIRARASQPAAMTTSPGSSGEPAQAIGTVAATTLPISRAAEGMARVGGTGAPGTPSTRAAAGAVPTSRTTLPVYWVTSSSSRSLLSREYRSVPDYGDPLLTAVQAVLRQRPLDPDYVSPWRPAASVHVTSSTTGIAVELSSDAVAATGVAGAVATAGVQQLVWTVTSAAHRDVPVTVRVDGRDGYLAWGCVRLGSGVHRDLQARAAVWIDSPLEGSTQPGTVRVSGQGSAFEGTYRWQVSQGGRQVAGGNAAGTATGPGTGWSQFAVDVRLPAGTYLLTVTAENPGQGEAPQGWTWPDTRSFTVG